MSAWSSNRILNAYGKYARRESSIKRSRPRDYSNPGLSIDTHQAAWLTVVSCKGYASAEHWLRYRYVFERDRVEDEKGTPPVPMPLEGELLVSEFIEALKLHLVSFPFVPENMEVEDTRGVLAFALVSSPDAAFMARRTVRTIQDWCTGPRPRLHHEWRGRRLYVRVGDLLELCRRMDKYGNKGPRKQKAKKEVTKPLAVA